jgi:hypothetical protein
MRRKKREKQIEIDRQPERWRKGGGREGGREGDLSRNRVEEGQDKRLAL